MAYKKDQTTIYVELKIIIKESHNDFIGLCIASDITIQKKLMGKVKHVRSDMKRLLKMKNVAVANIIHELRTPVSGIMGMAELLLDMNLNAEQAENVDIIYQSCKNLNSLINDLFDTVRMKNNKPILKEEKFDFYQMIDKIIKFYGYSIKKKQLKLIVSVSEDIPTYLVGDEFRLGQIIDNLLSNAIKFTHDGEVKLDASMTSYNDYEVELLFTIADTGIGIDDGEKEKIFMSYYQVDGSITRSYGGVGLGLSISQALVKAMGGKISVESETGKGSIFTFTVCLKNAATYNREIQNLSIPDENADFAMTQEYIYKMDDKLDTTIDDKTLMEMLKTAIEKDDWQCAEQLALRVRELIPHEDKLMANKILQLLFSIRKGERELSIKRVEELKDIQNMHP